MLPFDYEESDEESEEVSNFFQRQEFEVHSDFSKQFLFDYANVDWLNFFVRACVYVRVRVDADAHLKVCACVHVCLCVCGCVCI